jgi:YVTN family beta-propeller protein
MTASAPLRECVSDGYCYTCADGTAGVVFAPVRQTTTFALDIVATDANGDRSVTSTLETTVQVAVPSISQDSRVVASPSGRFARLHWLAYNARSCAVDLEGSPIDGATAAPPDTYLTGFPVYLSGTTSNPTLTVVASAIEGYAQASLNLAPIPTPAPISIAVGDGPQAVAVTPDSQVALVANQHDSTITVIDVATRQPESKTLRVGNNPQSIAVTPDSMLAFVVNGLDGTISVIDLASRSVERTALSIPQASSIAVTPDGSLLLVACASNVVMIVDIATRQIEVKSIAVGSSPADIAITPDGKLALVCNFGDNTVSVIDIAQRIAEPKAIPVGREPAVIAITPGSSTAVVTNAVDATVSVIDISGRRVRATPPTVPVPDSVAITLDGNHALIGSLEIAALSVLNLTTLATDTIALGSSPSAICMSPNGAFALVASAEDDVVTMI